jgi:hypothetical protein
MRDMVPNDGAVVDESTFSFGAVVIDVVVEALTNEVETMQMVETFNIGGEATAVLGVDLDPIWFDARFWSFVQRNCNPSVWDL